MGMTEFKVIIGIWLLAQAFIIPFIFIYIYGDDNKIVLTVDLILLAVDFGVLALLIIIYLVLKLMGV